MGFRAAEYVRMSTEHQKYSTENQSEAIRQYATRRGYEIVKTYSDRGKSGLRIDGRNGLKRLIDDVQSNNADFEAILVYDISRWGRFQDADESAYYEYICKRSGIRVEYCAEQFENDGSPVSTIVKGVKRAMAGEYSRELSAKVFAGQCRLIELGFRQGGPPGYGLRRKLIDQAGNAKGELAPGEHKSIQTDRVILVHGPLEEVDTVRWIYKSFISDHRSESEIAKLLNARGFLTDYGRPWTRGTVHQLLTNEKYVGNNVWNRRSFKLKRKYVTNSPDMWIRATGAFAPVIAAEDFIAAREIIDRRATKLSDDQMLEILQQILDANGQLSGIIIDECENAPSSQSYARRFGGLRRAYKLIGYAPDRDERYVAINQAFRRLHPEIISNIVEGIVSRGGRARVLQDTGTLLINEEVFASISISRCRATQAGTPRWIIRLERDPRPDLTIAVRMDSTNERPRDYYLLPRMDILEQKLRLGESNGIWIEAYRIEDLSVLFELAARNKVAELAA
ncbi:recombinase family protein [Hyphomicrobium sp. 802]|uniref:recombinase family protein n=1 Tax=unclassified Hyphomicrobium TaxID=2619925 RepID=UPI002477CD49|nr:recombinase family protein [Hyphomicrobium sp. 802]